MKMKFLYYTQPVKQSIYSCDNDQLCYCCKTSLVIEIVQTFTQFWELSNG